jgi:hypothetical protein
MKQKFLLFLLIIFFSFISLFVEAAIVKESGVYKCTGDNEEYSGGSCYCKFGYHMSNGICVEGVESTKITQQKNNCSAIICTPSCYCTGDQCLCSTVKKQAYWSDSAQNCLCPSGYSSNEAATEGGGSSGSGSSGSSSSGGSGTTAGGSSISTGNPSTVSIQLPSITDIKSISNPLSSSSFEELLNKLIDWILNMALVIAPLIIVYGGYLHVTAMGEVAKINKARNVILYATIGFIIALMAKELVKLFVDLVVK